MYAAEAHQNPDPILPALQMITSAPIRRRRLHTSACGSLQSNVYFMKPREQKLFSFFFHVPTELYSAMQMTAFVGSGWSASLVRTTKKGTATML